MPAASCVRKIHPLSCIAMAMRGGNGVPELRAIQTRIPTLQLTATNQELAALMRSVSQQGFQVLLQVIVG